MRSFHLREVLNIVLAENEKNAEISTRFVFLLDNTRYHGLYTYLADGGLTSPISMYGLPEVQSNLGETVLPSGRYR